MVVTWPFAFAPDAVQTAALDAGQGRTAFGYFLEQGLGKTRLALADFAVQRAAGKVSHAIVVAPASFTPEWCAEAAACGLTSVLWGARNSYARMEEAAITVISFDGLPRLIDEWGRWGWPAPMLIVDESIKVKDPKTRAARSCKWLGQRAASIRLLSGKPVTQGPHDLWSQFNVMGVVPMNRYAWRNHYCQLGGFMGKQVLGAKNEVELNAFIRQHAFIARKADWATLPPKSYHTIASTMDAAHLKMYKQMEHEFVLDLATEPLMAEMVLTRDMKLRQIASGFVMDHTGTVTELVPPAKNRRLQTLMGLLEATRPAKTVVVAVHKHSMDMLVAAIGPDTCAWIRGGMTPAEIQEQKRRFNEDDRVTEMVVQQRSAKYGHTLLGSTNAPCSHMAFFEQSYSLDDRGQIEDRIHRRGQRLPCDYYDFAVTPLDRACARALQRKESVAAAVLGYAPLHAAAGDVVGAL